MIMILMVGDDDDGYEDDGAAAGLHSAVSVLRFEVTRVREVSDSAVLGTPCCSRSCGCTISWLTYAAEQSFRNETCLKKWQTPIHPSKPTKSSPMWTQIGHLRPYTRAKWPIEDKAP